MEQTRLSANGKAATDADVDGEHKQGRNVNVRQSNVNVNVNVSRTPDARVFLTRTCPNGDSLSKKWHSTSPPQIWTDWPDLPTITKHKCQSKNGTVTTSESLHRTLALQVYPNLIVAKRPTRFDEFLDAAFISSETHVWTSSSKVALHVSGNEPTSEGSVNWVKRTSTSKLMPMLTPMLDTCALELLKQLFPTSTWDTLNHERRLTLVAFPTTRLLQRLVCHKRVIIAVLHGQARLAWTTPEIFYSQLPVVRPRKSRHGVDINFAESIVLRDFHIVDKVLAGFCLYVREGATFQMTVKAESVLAIVTEPASTSPFQRLTDWLVFEKGLSLTFICSCYFYGNHFIL